MKTYCGVVVALGSAGAEVIVGVPLGGVVSIVHVRVVAVPRLPAASTSATWNVCAPSANEPEARGDRQAAQAAPSSLHV